MAALLGSPWLGGSAVAATTTYSGTTGSFTIGVGDTAVLINGADITGDVTNDGTLQFDLSTDLTVSNLISGIGDVILTNTGTITFSGSNSYLAGTTIRYGELVITAGGAIDHPAEDMIVGNVSGDSGALTLSGGRVASFDGVLGKAAGSYGAVTVGSGTWAIDNDLDVGYGGSGTLTLSGGSVTVAGSVLLGRDGGSTGDLIMSGGTFTVGSVLNVGFGGVGSLNMTGGTINADDSYIGANASSSGTATITSGTWTSTRNLIVGFGGGFGSAGTLNISGDGVVVVGDTLYRDPTLGEINLNSGGTLQIGTSGTTGALNTDLTNNGTLIFDRADLSQYNYLVSGSGNVIKRGAGTLQFTGSNSYSGGTEILDGRIDVTFGGAIDQPLATLSIGDAGGAIGGLDVSGGYVGSSRLDLSNGDLNLSNGLVETGTARIGLFGTGTATIGGGVWDVDSLFVGSSGTGTMDVTGGTVTSSEAILGTLAGDSGTVTVTTAGIWNSYGNLTVGGGGTGSLTISNGGEVLVTGTLSKGAGSLINLNAAGTLRIGDGGTTGTLATDLTNDGLLVFNRSNDATYAGTIVGSGDVTKSGTGALTFTGSNTYTGLTTIEAGSFYLEGSLGNTAVVVNDGALLGGNGTVLGGVTVGDVSGTAVLSPGSLSDAIATLSVGSLELRAGSLTLMSVTGTQAGLDYDQISGIGGGPTLVYGGDLEISLSGGYADNTTFNLFANFTSNSGQFDSITLNATGPYSTLSGTFTYNAESGVWATAWTPANQRLVFSTVTGDLIVVPEPSAFVLGAAGIGLVGLLRWRRRGQRTAGRPSENVSDKASDQA